MPIRPTISGARARASSSCTMKVLGGPGPPAAVLLGPGDPHPPVGGQGRLPPAAEGDLLGQVVEPGREALAVLPGQVLHAATSRMSARSTDFGAAGAQVHRAPRGGRHRRHTIQPWTSISRPISGRCRRPPDSCSTTGRARPGPRPPRVGRPLRADAVAGHGRPGLAGGGRAGGRRRPRTRLGGGRRPPRGGGPAPVAGPLRPAADHPGRPGRSDRAHGPGRRPRWRVATLAAVAWTAPAGRPRARR